MHRKREHKYITKRKDEIDLLNRSSSIDSWCVTKRIQSVKKIKSPIRCFYEVPKAPRNTTKYIIEERKLDNIIPPPRQIVRNNSMSTIKSCINSLIPKSNLQIPQRLCKIELRSEPSYSRRREKNSKIQKFSSFKDKEKIDPMRENINDSMFNCMKPKAQFITEFDENNDELFYGSISQHDCFA